jgi:hypothetical protein
MGLLARIEGSVLWLSEVSDGTKFNLHQHAAARGADPARLIFAPRVDEAEHLARHRLADLFLDTFPASTQTAASDALWAGLPVLTCRGNTFAGRVAASQLQSLGLAELVTSSLADYTALAQWLAEDRDILAEIRKRLAENRSTRPLFDTDLTRHHLEEAYTVMWARRQAGGRPASFEVEARPEPPPPPLLLPLAPPPATPETTPAPADAAAPATADPVTAPLAEAVRRQPRRQMPLRHRRMRRRLRMRRRRCRPPNPEPGLHCGGARSNSIGTIGASLELRSVSVVLTLRT